MVSRLLSFVGGRVDLYCHNLLVYQHLLMNNNKVKENVVLGTVEEALPNTLFRVLIKEGEVAGEVKLAYLSGKMRKFRIKVLVGDKVSILLDPYGGKGRIIKRL